MIVHTDIRKKLRQIQKLDFVAWLIIGSQQNNQGK